MSLIACSDNREQEKQRASQQNAARQAIVTEEVLFNSPDAAIEELRRRIAEKIIPQNAGIYLKSVGIIPQTFFLSRNSAWRAQCGFLGFSIIFQPSAGDDNAVDLKLTQIQLSDQICEATVPTIGAYVASLVARSN